MEVVTDYLEKSLDDDLRQDTDEHLDGCRQCVVYLGQIQTLIHLVRTLAEQTPNLSRADSIRLRGSSAMGTCQAWTWHVPIPSRNAPCEAATPKRADIQGVVAVRAGGCQSWAMIGQLTMKPVATHGPLGKPVILPAAARSAILATSLWRVGV